MFQACRELTKEQNGKLSTLDPDTNAQENIGKQFQEVFPSDKASIGDLVYHIWSYVNLDRQDRGAVRSGIPRKYGFLSPKSKERKKKKNAAKMMDELQIPLKLYSQAQRKKPNKKKKRWKS